MWAFARAQRILITHLVKEPFSRGLINSAATRFCPSRLYYPDGNMEIYGHKINLKRQTVHIREREKFKKEARVLY